MEPEYEDPNQLLSKLWICERKSWILLKKQRVLIFYDEKYSYYLEVLLNIQNPTFFTVESIYKIDKNSIPDFLLNDPSMIAVFPYKGIDKIRIHSAFIERNCQIENYLYIGNYYRDIYLFQNGLESFHASKIWIPKDKTYRFYFYTVENNNSTLSIFGKIKNIGEQILSKLFRNGDRDENKS